jgi:hypothetical protein
MRRAVHVLPQREMLHSNVRPVMSSCKSSSALAPRRVLPNKIFSVKIFLPHEKFFAESGLRLFGAVAQPLREVAPSALR